MYNISLPNIQHGRAAGLSLKSQVSTVSDVNHTLQYLSNYSIKALESSNPFEIIGDNVDWTKSPSHMTRERQRQRLHWFINLAVYRRITNNALPDIAPKDNILHMRMHLSYQMKMKSSTLRRTMYIISVTSSQSI